MHSRVVLTLAMLAAVAPGVVAAQPANPSLSLAGDAAPFTYAQLLADMAQSDVAAALAAIGAVSAETEVGFIPAASLAGSPDATVSALAKVSAGSARLDVLRAAVVSNAALMEKLATAGYEAADVLAVQPEESGALVVYVAG